MSTSADNIADTQSIINAVKNRLSLAHEVIISANISNTPACSKPQTITNKAQKNNNTDSSNFSNIF
ncbi:hypothetical protein HOF65_00360 [bacterium]|nr:hypothetical protein [bacterium]MBT5491449.1 hypothetical protein [bacterium]MBT6778313.1 hypothetical protein [bacterium]